MSRFQKPKCKQSRYPFYYWDALWLKKGYIIETGFQTKKNQIKGFQARVVTRVYYTFKPFLLVHTNAQYLVLSFWTHSICWPSESEVFGYFHGLFVNQKHLGFFQWKRKLNKDLFKHLNNREKIKIIKMM